MIQVEKIVDDYFPSLREPSSPLRKPIMNVLRLLFHEREFQQFETDYPHLRGLDFVEQVLAYFDFNFSVRSREKEHIPTHGRVVIIANHPIGSLDGLALLKLVSEVRQDVKVMANELLMAIEPLHSLLLAVDNMNDGTPKENLRAIYQHLNNEGALIVFPAGEVSRMSPAGIRDGRWHSGFLRIARKMRAPILPVFIDGKNSAFFYSLSLVAKPLSTLWLVREMFKQAENSVDVRIGDLISHRQYQSLDLPTKSAVKLFRKHVYRLQKDKPVLRFGQGLTAVAHPESRQALKREIRECTLLGSTTDHKQIRLYRYCHDSALMREIGRLRELTFRAVDEGTGGRRDVDRFDADYDHIILWDEEELEIVGAYRLRPTAAIADTPEKLYSSTLFAFQAGFSHYLASGLELGRSFVQPRYWGKRSLDYLWQGIGAYLQQQPGIRYLFGPVSISNHYPQAARDLIVRFYDLWFGSQGQALVHARHPYRPDPCNFSLFQGEDYASDFRALKQVLAEMGCTIPTLYKQYTELCEPGGTCFLGFHLDHHFADCVDGFVIVDLERLKPARRERYLPART